MKKLLISILAMFFCIASIGQPTSSRKQLTQKDYWEKSANQRRFAKILLYTGGIVTTAGVIILITSESLADPGAYATGVGLFGGGLMAASIPLFIASARNGRKGDEMTLNLGFEKSVVFQQMKRGSNYYPALSFKIRIK